MEIVAVQAAGMEIHQMAEGARVVPVTVEDQDVATIVQTGGEEVKMVHQMEDGVTILQDVLVAGHLHEALIPVATVEAEVNVHIQEAPVVLPETEGEQAKRKVVLLQAPVEILVDRAKKNRAPALFFLFHQFLKNILWQQKPQPAHLVTQTDKEKKACLINSSLIN